MRASMAGLLGGGEEEVGWMRGEGREAEREEGWTGRGRRK